MTSSFSRFLKELRRRKVYQVGAAYLAASVVLATGTAEIYAYLLLPEWTPGLVILLLIVGFPVALVLAWAYEVRPELPPEPETAEEENSGARTIIGTRPFDQEERKSIVVLPFDNLSPDPKDAYFSDGLTEEIITNLSHLHSLRVISRNSSMTFRGSQKDTRTIARELSVQYVLEGSVRKAGDDLRITAQLIDGSSDTHLWAEKYDGVLKDVFGIQEEVSRSIVDALKVTLNPEEDARIGTRPVEELGAYECYLKARHHVWLLTDDSLEEATTLLDRGLAAQPDSAVLHAMKAFVNCQYLNMMSRPPATYPALLQEARDWNAQALALDPKSSVAHFVQGGIHWFNQNPPGAVASWVKAVTLNPNHTDALHWLGFALFASGRHLERALDYLERAGKLDPLSPLNAEIAQSYPAWYTGDFREVLRKWEAWRSADSPLLRLYIGYFFAASGQRAEAIEVFGTILRDTPGHPAAAAGAFLGNALQGKREEAIHSMTEDLELAAWWDDFTPVVVADGYVLIGEEEKAIRWIDRAIEMGTTNVLFLGDHEPFLRNLRGNAHFELLLEKAKMRSDAVTSQTELPF